MLFCHYNAKRAYLCRRYDEFHELCNELFVQRNAYFQYLDKSYYLTGDQNLGKRYTKCMELKDTKFRNKNCVFVKKSCTHWPILVWMQVVSLVIKLLYNIIKLLNYIAYEVTHIQY